MAQFVAIKIEGLRETVKGLKEFEDELEDMKNLHQRVGNLVLATARRKMPHVSGALYNSYRAARIKSGAKITGSAVYAGVSEFGGSIPRFHSKSKTLHKPKAKAVGLSSYYVYPAIEEKRKQIEKLYYDEIEKIRKKELGEG